MSERDPLPSQSIPLLGAPASLPPARPSGALPPERREIAATEFGSAFELASAELGFVSASWLFVEAVAKASGDEAVAALRDELGASFSVLEHVATQWLEGERPKPVDTRAVTAALAGARRVLVVGVEANHIDALVRDLDPSVAVGLVTYRLQEVDWARVIDNFGGRVEPVDLAEFQAWAGARSAILTFVYGTRGELMNVLPAFLRVVGADVRTQFRDVIGWSVIDRAPEVYPRYLVETLTSELTMLVEPGED
jgi:hypothetical protein